MRMHYDRKVWNKPTGERTKRTAQMTTALSKMCAPQIRICVRFYHRLVKWTFWQTVGVIEKGLNDLTFWKRTGPNDSLESSSRANIPSNLQWFNDFFIQFHSIITGWHVWLSFAIWYHDFEPNAIDKHTKHCNCFVLYNFITTFHSYQSLVYCIYATF